MNGQPSASGPLQTLLRADAPPTPEERSESLYPHALEVPWPTASNEAPEAAVALVCWRTPPSPQALHDNVKRILERTLLHELSRTASELREHGRLRYRRLWLISFAKEPLTPEALRAFGFERAQPGHRNDPNFQRALARIRGEAQRIGISVEESNAVLFETAIVCTEAAEQLEEFLERQLGEARWGQPPGGMAEQLAAFKPPAKAPPIVTTGKRIDGTALDRLERQLCPSKEGALRWLPPLAFQAFCDAIGIAISRPGRVVEWASAEETEESTPPWLRIRDEGGEYHVPIGLELLRWCVMPKQAGEVIPPICEWARSAFP